VSDVSWVLDIYVVEYLELNDQGVLLNSKRKVVQNKEFAIDNAQWLKEQTYSNGERRFVSINVWGISHETKEHLFIKWWEE
jgi:hypothetical protein